MRASVVSEPSRIQVYQAACASCEKLQAHSTRNKRLSKSEESYRGNALNLAPSSVKPIQISGSGNLLTRLNIQAALRGATIK